MKIFYSAYTCKGNIGDLLINKYQIEEYSKYGDVYVDLSGMPDWAIAAGNTIRIIRYRNQV